MLTFGTVVSVNNLLALKAFNTFLFNYNMHEKPSWIERKMLPVLKRWVDKRAQVTLNELLLAEDAKSASVALNDVSADFFAVLYIVQNPYLVAEVVCGQELFIMLAQMALEFEKVKKQKTEIGYEPRSPK